MNRKAPARTALLLAAALAMSGCKEVLYSGLTEADANEMTTILATSGIDVARQRDKDGVYEILVAESDVAAANSLLISSGLPRKRFARMDEIFDNQGLVGSPFEERVRYIFALEQKMTEHLVSIHGVRDARVTINLPERARFSDNDTPPSASVILHYEPDFDVSPSIPKIKTLMANSVEGLVYEAVSIVVFPAKTTATLSDQLWVPPVVNSAQITGPLSQASTEVIASTDRTLVTLILGLLVVLCLLGGLRALMHGNRTRGL